MVATALQALRSAAARLWERYDNGDNLLFKETDLQGPDKSAFFAELHKLADPRGPRMLTEELHKSIVRNLAEVPRIDELLPEAKGPKPTIATAFKPVEGPIAVAAPVEAEATAANALDFGEPNQTASKAQGPARGAEFPLGPGSAAESRLWRLSASFSSPPSRRW